MFCATAKGEKSPATQDFEKSTDRAVLIKAIKDVLQDTPPELAADIVDRVRGMHAVSPVEVDA